MDGYNFDFAMSATISSDVVGEMIKNVVEQQTGKKVVQVKINTRDVTTGQGYGERKTTVFDGVTVYFDRKQKV